MEVLVVNLPHRERIQRRWVASYHAPNFLVPPVELLGLASLARDRGGADVRFVDAVADSWSVDQLAQRLRGHRPDLVVALAGFGILEEDLAALADLRAALGEGTRSAVFGYLPTVDPEPVARREGIDFVLVGEPERPLLGLLEALGGTRPLSEVPGLAYVDAEGALRRTEPPPRLDDLDSLPFADHRFVDVRAYTEPFVQGPVGAILSARGCPYPCRFCVRTFGRQIVKRSWRSLAEEAALLRGQGLKNIRFLDDTFTVDRERVERLCETFARGLPDLRWSCLTRVDRVDEGLAEAMAEGGCRRVYLGVESADPERLKWMNKGIDPAQARTAVGALKRRGIETCGFFLVGLPGETDDEVLRSADFAADIGLDWIIVTRLQHWPGTDLHAGAGLSVEERGVQGNAEEGPDPYRRERLFYRRFYGNPRVMARQVGRSLRRPMDAAAGLRVVAEYATGRVKGRDLI